MQVASLYGQKDDLGEVTFSVRILTTGGHPYWTVAVHVCVTPRNWGRVQRTVTALLRAIEKAGVVDRARWEPPCAP